MTGQDLTNRIRAFHRASSITTRVRILRSLAVEPAPEVDQLLIQALRDPSAKVRHTALQLLDRRGFRDRQITLAMLGDGSKVVRRLALRMLRAWPEPELIPKVLPFLEDEDLSLRLLAIDWLYSLGPRALPYLRPLARDAMYSVRSKVQHCIRDLEKQQAIQDALVQPASPEQAPSAERETAPIPATALSYDTDTRWREPIPHVRRRADTLWQELEQLRMTQPDALADRLQTLLEDPRWPNRERVIRWVQQQPDFPTRVMYELLAHPIWYVRAAVIEILGHFQDPVLLEYAFDLARDRNVEVRRALTDAMLRYGESEDARMVLEKLARDPHFMIRRRAREHLSQLRNRKEE